MNRNKELIKNTVIIFIGKLCTQLLTFFLLPLYTAKLATGDYGVIDLIISYVQLLVPVITIQLEMAAFRFLIDARDDDLEKKKIITNIMYLVMGISVVFVVLYLLLIQVVEIAY